MRDTPLIFIGLYRLYRHGGSSRRASIKEAWQRITHRLY
jgi:hypothetical protein